TVGIYTPAFALLRFGAARSAFVLRASARHALIFTALGGTSMATVSESVLPPQLLARCRERAPEYDRENCFFKEDFDELKAAGYLRMALPGEFGGLGMNVAEVGRETRKLA